MSPVFYPDYDLTAHNTLATPSICSWYCELKDIDQLAAIEHFANQQQLPIKILGQGSNILVDRHVQALVVKNALQGREVVTDNSLMSSEHFESELVKTDAQLIRFAAGEDWHESVKWSLDNHYFGLENLALIPGTCGAAPVQNIGAYGRELSDFLVAVEVFEFNNTSEKLDLGRTGLQFLCANECEFEYRDSRFKRYSTPFVITSIYLSLYRSSSKVNASYPALRDYLNQHSLPESPESVFEAVCDIRQSKLPSPSVLPNVGSFFHNPIVSRKTYEQLLEFWPDMPAFSAGSDKKIPAAWLIDWLGWKGHKIDGVGMHEVHALVLINYDGKPTEVIRGYAAQIQKEIQQTFGIKLTIEPGNF